MSWKIKVLKLLPLALLIASLFIEVACAEWHYPNGIVVWAGVRSYMRLL